jgi:hypothetical protein
MSSLQIQSSQLVNSIPSYHVQMSIKTFIAICLIMVILILSFIFCLIFVYKFSQKNKKLETDKIIKEEKNILIEEELKNIKLIINLLQDEFHNKYTEMENKNNIMSEEILIIKDKEIETQLQQQDKNNLLINEYKNLKDEINVLTHNFNYHHSTQGDNLNLLTEDLRQINRKVDQQQQINQEKNNLLSNEIKNLKNEIDVYLPDKIDKIDVYSTDNIDKIKCINLNQNEKINLLEENIGKISNKVTQQKQIIENNKIQCVRFNAFLDNFAINRHSFSSIRLNGSTLIPMDSMSSIGISTLRILYSIEQKFNLKYYDNYNKIIISQNNDNATSRNVLIEISIIDDEKATDNTTHFHSRQLPLYMLCLLFGTKIITFDGEDVTDLFENNFNTVKRYHDSRIDSTTDQPPCVTRGTKYYKKTLTIEESKRISDMCNVEYVLEMFK